MQPNLYPGMRLASPVTLSHFIAGFQPSCGFKDFWTACCLLLLLAAVAAKMCCPAFDRKRWCKTSTG